MSVKKIKNPYSDYPSYNCFGCSPTNSFGLKMEFFEDGDLVICNWPVEANFQGYINILHGGIQATLMDEIASWVVLIKLKTAGVTAKLITKYIQPVVAEGTVKVCAKLREMKRNIAVIDIELFDTYGKKCCVGEASYFTFPREEAIKNWGFPEGDDFYE